MEYMQLAESSWQTAWEILHDTDGWTLDTGDNLSTGLVYHKYYTSLGKVSKLQVRAKLHTLFMFRDLNPFQGIQAVDRA